MSQSVPFSPQRTLVFLARLEELLDGFRPAGGDSLPGGRRHAARLAVVARRLREGVNAPLRLAIFGPTGVGKSKIFNSLAGADLSPSGFRRPYTRNSVRLVHATRRALLPPDEHVKSSTADAWRDIVLIDTPDFDSVERENRLEAERVFSGADAFLFVTDAQKYADHATWEYLQRIFQGGRRVILVLNKATSSECRSDFAARLAARFEAAGRDAKLVVIEEHALDDKSPLPAGDPGLQELRSCIADLVEPRGRRKALLVDGLRRDLEELKASWSRDAAHLEECLAALASLEERVELRHREAVDRLGVELETEIDSTLKADLHARVLERLQKIDVLRYPRKLLSLPFRGVKSIVRRWLPSRDEGGAVERDETVSMSTFHPLERLVLQLTDGVIADFEAEPRWPALSLEEGLAGVRFSHDELRAAFKTREETYRQWLQQEARETASRLTGEHKLKFILSQVLYNSVVVGVQIHTAGGFTIAELLTDTVLSPLVAKAVGIAVSSEAVARFTRAAKEEHHRVLREILDACRDRFLRFLKAHGSWEGVLRDIGEDMTVLEKEADGIVDAYRAGRRFAGTGGTTDASSNES